MVMIMRCKHVCLFDPSKIKQLLQFESEVHSDFVFLDKPDIIPGLGWLVVQSRRTTLQKFGKPQHDT